MNKRIILSSVLAWGAISAIAAAHDPVTIAWKPKVGDSYKFKWNLVAPNVGGSDMKLGSDMTETIKAINTDGSVVVEDKQTHISLMMGGNDLSNNASVPQQIVETVTEAANGHVLKRSQDPPGNDSPRTDALSQFIFPDHPVNVGDTWTYKGTGDKAAGTYDFQMDYTYRGTEQVDGINCNKVDVSVKETNAPTPITGTGTVWIDANNGELVKLNMNLKNADLGMLGQTDLTVSTDRQP